MLRATRSESAPSAIIHFAFGSMPASSRMVDSSTPVHSEQEARPWICWTVAWIGSLENIVPLLPPHSTKCLRVTIG